MPQRAAGSGGLRLDRHRYFEVEAVLERCRSRVFLDFLRREPRQQQNPPDPVPPELEQEDVEKRIAAALNAHLDPIRERRAAALAKPGYIRDVLFEGSKRARTVAAGTMARVRDAMKISYR